MVMYNKLRPSETFLNRHRLLLPDLYDDYIW